MKRYFTLTSIILLILTACSAGGTVVSEPETQSATATSIPALSSTPTGEPLPTGEPTLTPTPELPDPPYFEEAACFTGELKDIQRSDFYDLTCGYVTVLEDRDNPDGRRIKMPVTVFRSQSVSPRPVR